MSDKQDKQADAAKEALSPLQERMIDAYNELETALELASKSVLAHELPVVDLWPIAQHLIEEAHAKLGDDETAANAVDFAASLEQAKEDPVLARFVAGVAQ